MTPRSLFDGGHYSSLHRMNLHWPVRKQERPFSIWSKILVSEITLTLRLLFWNSNTTLSTHFVKTIRSLNTCVSSNKLFKYKELLFYWKSSAYHHKHLNTRTYCADYHQIHLNTKPTVLQVLIGAVTWIVPVENVMLVDFFLCYSLSLKFLHYSKL